MAKRITNTIFSIPKLNGQDYYNIRVMVDIKHLNLDKIKVYQFKGKNKASPYYSIVVPAKWILNRNEEKRNEPLMVTPTKEVLDYNLNEILKKYVKHYTDVGFDKQSQDYVEYAKSPHQDFTKNQIKWINEVNDKLSSLNVLDFSNIKVGCALMSWDMKAGSRTLGCALIKENIVLFNQNHLFHYDEFSLKEVYTHELTHLAVEHSEYGNLLIPHSLPFIAYQNQFNKKVFGEETARSLLAWNIVRYSGALEQVKRDNDSLVELTDFYKIKGMYDILKYAKNNNFKFENNPLEDYKAVLPPVLFSEHAESIKNVIMQGMQKGQIPQIETAVYTKQFLDFVNKSEENQQNVNIQEIAMQRGGR